MLYATPAADRLLANDMHESPSCWFLNFEQAAKSNCDCDFCENVSVKVFEGGDMS